MVRVIIQPVLSKIHILLIEEILNICKEEDYDEKILLISSLLTMLFGGFISTSNVEAKSYKNMDEMAMDLFPKIFELQGKDIKFDEKDYEIIKYEDIMRERNGLEDVKHTFYAEIQQYDEGENIAEGLIMRDGDLDRAYYFIIPNLPDKRLMEGDVVDVYGTLHGLLTYETVIGGSKTVSVIIIDNVLVEGIDY